MLKLLKSIGYWQSVSTK